MCEFTVQIHVSHLFCGIDSECKYAWALIIAELYLIVDLFYSRIDNAYNVIGICT